MQSFMNYGSRYGEVLPIADDLDIPRKVLVIEDDQSLHTIMRRIVKSIDPNIDFRVGTDLQDAYQHLGQAA